MKEGYRGCCGMDVHKDSVVVCVLQVTREDQFFHTLSSTQNTLYHFLDETFSDTARTEIQAAIAIKEPILYNEKRDQHSRETT